MMNGILVQKCSSWGDLYQMIQVCRQQGYRDIILVVPGKKFKLEVWRPPVSYYPLYLSNLDGQEFLAVGCNLGYDSPNDRIDRWHLLNREEEVLRWAGISAPASTLRRREEPVL